MDSEDIKVDKYKQIEKESPSFRVLYGLQWHCVQFHPISPKHLLAYMHSTLCQFLLINTQCTLNDSQLAKLKQSISVMPLP